ncbi:anhydro-N-acetylmuramic acid kinase [Streptomyces yokosukanensis]|uniref:Anhydro-N-acetylmuramic acid kinase n=1 Tax=Streptomyces yokosukanensis TaxID=67386 RepID=A0A101P1M8_9ACTN|nr:anhydro-N-acetylmuramic acid kinase [Streptomyces yokosukanensis]KUN03286.1 anhydro-N-acetylmuramic acid kinase [Streptomyces yokosukanensis]
MRVIGLMSGTSYDAVDAAAAVLRLDGDTLLLRPLGMVSTPYDDGLRAALTRALSPAAAPAPASGQGCPPLASLAEVCRLDTGIGRAFAAAAVRADRELCGGQAELVASHGQTVYHWAEGNRVHGTLQLGRPAWIAEASGLPVVADFRARDVAAGGQGAPLVSLVDLLWLRGRPGRVVALNIGGVANVTAPDGTAFDTGPGCALLDAAVREFSGGRAAYDVDGALAGRGRPVRRLLDRLLADPYYALAPPKTTGKEVFHAGYLRTAGLFDGIRPEDALATLAQLTARTIADAVRSVGATEVIASGGGVRNPVLTGMLRERLAPVPVRVSDALGLPAAAKEAYAFAVLGFLTVHGLPGTDPRSTGARHPSVLGSLTPGRDGFRLPPAGACAPARMVVEG